MYYCTGTPVNQTSDLLGELCRQAAEIGYAAIDRIGGELRYLIATKHGRCRR